MKLFHLSDLHIGKRVNEISMIEDQKYILERILDLAEVEKPDGIILAGDITINRFRPRRQCRYLMYLSQSLRRKSFLYLLSAVITIRRKGWPSAADC